MSGQGGKLRSPWLANRRTRLSGRASALFARPMLGATDTADVLALTDWTFEASASGITATAVQPITFSQSATATLAITATASQEIAIGQTATAALAIQASATQAITFTQSASATLSSGIEASATLPITFTQSAAASLAITATATQPITIAQSASAQLAIQASATLPITFSQSATSSLAIQGQTGSAITITQSATATLPVQASATLPIAIGQSSTASFAITAITANATQPIVIGQVAEATLGDVEAQHGSRYRHRFVSQESVVGRVFQRFAAQGERLKREEPKVVDAKTPPVPPPALRHEPIVEDVSALVREIEATASRIDRLMSSTADLQALEQRANSIALARLEDRKQRMEREVASIVTKAIEDDEDDAVVALVMQIAA